MMQLSQHKVDKEYMMVDIFGKVKDSIVGRRPSSWMPMDPKPMDAAEGAIHPKRGHSGFQSHMGCNACKDGVHKSWNLFSLLEVEAKRERALSEST